MLQGEMNKMWNFFRRKKETNQNEESKLHRYESEKEAALKLAKEQFVGFDFSYEYVSDNLCDFVFVDQFNRQIGIYKKEEISDFKSGNNNQKLECYVIPFKEVEHFGLVCDSKDFWLWSDPQYPLSNQYDNSEALSNELVRGIEPAVFKVSFYFAERNKDFSTENKKIYINYYERENERQQFGEKVNELKEVLNMFLSCILDGEKEYLHEMKVSGMEYVIQELEEKNERADKIGGKLGDSIINEPLLTLLFHNWELFLDDLNYNLHSFIFAPALNLNIKGYENGVLLIGCDIKYMDFFDIPQAKRIIELSLHTYNFSKIAIVPNDIEIEQISLVNNLPIWEQILRELWYFLKYYEGYEFEGEVRTYREGKLFIDYDGEDIIAVREMILRSIYNEHMSSALTILTGGPELEIEIMLVNSQDSIEKIALENLEELWSAVLQNVERKTWWREQEEKPIVLSSNAHSLREGNLVVYISKEYNPHLHMSSEVIKELEYNFYIHTGIRYIQIEFVNTPENNELIKESIPEKVLDWVEELKKKQKKQFKFLDLRKSNGVFLILVDSQMYMVMSLNFYSIDEEQYKIEKTPRVSNLTKKSMRVYEGFSKKEMYIDEIEFTYSVELELEIEEYLIELDCNQQEEMEPIRKILTTNKRVVELFQGFYIKEIKNHVTPMDFDDIVNEMHSLEGNIRKFANFLIKKAYLNGENYLIYSLIREQIVELAIKNVSSIFLQQNKKVFENIEEMSLDDCISVYQLLDFANVENDEHVASFVCFLLDNNKILIKGSYYQLMEQVRHLLHESGEEEELNAYEEYLLADNNPSQEVAIELIDTMDGYEFEAFLSDLFNRMGYNTEITKGSGDYGIDLIAIKKGLSIGIQAKCYSGKVPNKAVQEVIAGIAYYKLDQGMVVTNSYFTKPAYNQANGSNVILWDRDMLIQKIRKVYASQADADILN
ncbi:restriction endonuclease [Bacillus paranthracis]|nr:restriction endonuclease [Bacillus paranthracis]TKC26066.1 restriction endonuclease [Bacillus paranthracis]